MDTGKVAEKLSHQSKRLQWPLITPDTYLVPVFCSHQHQYSGLKRQVQTKCIKETMEDQKVILDQTLYSRETIKQVLSIIFRNK